MLYIKFRISPHSKKHSQNFALAKPMLRNISFLAKQIKKVSAALKPPYEELEEFLKQQSHSRAGGNLDVRRKHQPPSALSLNKIGMCRLFDT